MKIRGGTKMGGTVTVVLREPNGKTHVQCRWTNALPWFVNNIRFVEKSSEHVAGYLKNQNDVDKKDNDILAPQDYGIVVLDQMRDRILTYQGYCSFGNIDTMRIAGDLDICVDKKIQVPAELGTISTKYVSVPLKMDVFKLTDDELHAVRFREFYEKSRIAYAKNERTGEIKETKGLSLDELAKFAEQDRTFDFTFVLDMSPFEIVQYHQGWSHDNDQLSLIKADIKRFGFKYSKKDEKAWKEFMEEK